MLSKRKVSSQNQEESSNSIEQLCNKIRKVIVSEVGEKYIQNHSEKGIKQKRTKHKAKREDEQYIIEIIQNDPVEVEEQLSSIKAISESQSWLIEELIEEINKFNTHQEIE
ncbi:unnamed protein product (macronuclear) [Paramecium tetraurelia]|uniref:Uncharacterized protein n=2 Tax=Paramecium TaxID=5884 RepID=A0DR19_PARTE|nr:uncharacterized protein GSPATT00002887001 [Paramecium tetraurelia]CAD8138789.1 unnamed protein product [Paramecium octaurelia]CAK85486.1 unnamed protein product [Paramecium tetraurelia]|eukprot:XP_001452883.1 hypothetical protein (macronuclear) [Paramecium tetraurelia strain d4-2]